MSETTKPQAKKSPVESAKAEEAFADYVGLGTTRSIRALAALYVQQNRYKTTATAERILNTWSTQYRWQSRLVDAATARSTAMLEQAAELDADTFLVTSQLLNSRAHLTTAMDTDHVVKMRESVRKPMPKGGASVNVNVSVEVRHLAEQMAKSLGISPEELIAEANEIAATEWEKVS